MWPPVKMDHMSSMHSLGTGSSPMSTPQRKLSGQLDCEEQHAHYDSVSCCFLCMETFTKPVSLECEHMFCERCLQGYYNLYHNVQYEQTGIFVPCPTCRKLSKVPEEGLTKLVLDEDTHLEKMRKISLATEMAMQRCEVCVFNFKLQEADVYCTKCMLNFCDKCRGVHDRQTMFKSHSLIHMSNKEILNLTCEHHDKMKSLYFCLDCNKPTCAICIMTDHTGHHSSKLRDALSNRRDSMKTKLNTFGPRLDKLDQKVKKLNHMHMVHSRKVNGIHLTPDFGLSRSAEHKEHKNNNGLLKHLSVPDLTVEGQLRTFTFHIDRLKKLFDLATKTLEMSHSKKLLAIYSDLMARIDTAIDIDLQHLQGDIDQMLEREMESVAELMQKNSNSSSVNSLAGMGSLSSTSDSSVEDPIFTMQPESSLLVKPKLQWKHEHQRNDVGELWNPCDAMFMPDGTVVVAEYDSANDKNNRLHFFDQVGTARGTIAGGQIRPLGVALTREGNIAVTDCKGKRVKVFTPTGQLLMEMGRGQFGWPYGIVVNSKGNLIVSDAFNDFIAIYQPDGKKIKQFGTSGVGSTQFRNPYHVAVDNKDNILVSDSGNNCVKVYDCNGTFKFRTSESQHGSSGGSRRKRRLKAPRGIVTDLKDHILVADDRSRVCLFNREGKYIRNLLTEEDSVKYPEALAMSSHGQLVVTEWNPNNMYAIKVFDLYD